MVFLEAALSIDKKRWRVIIERRVRFEQAERNRL
jgi:hypothetical protein